MALAINDFIMVVANYRRSQYYTNTLLHTEYILQIIFELIKDSERLSNASKPEISDDLVSLIAPLSAPVIARYILKLG